MSVHTVKSIGKIKSKYGGDVYVISFSVEGSRQRVMTYVDPGNKNYRNWKFILDTGKGARVTGLNMKSSKLVDADSQPVVIGLASTEPEPSNQMSLI